MIHLIFLIVLAIIWLVFASVYDLRKRIVPNWLSFSLIIFALGFRFFYSLFNENFLVFYQGLIGLGVFFIIGNLLYYGRVFAGGDTKLMIALGPVLGFSESITKNLELFLFFVILFLFVGGIYGLAWSVFLVSRNFKIFKKEFINQFNKGRRFIFSLLIFALFFIVMSFFDGIFIYLGILIFATPYLYLYAKAVDNTALIKKTSVSKLEEGDWLYKDLKIGKKVIKAKWSGLTKKQIKDIQREYNKIEIRQGIPFVPTFLISFLIFIYFVLQGINIFNLL